MTQSETVPTDAGEARVTWYAGTEPGAVLALGHAAVLALSFPLHPPGRPERSRAEELLGTGLPTLVVQGGNDPFGRPGEFPEGPYRLVEIPYGDHGFALPKRAPLGPDDARELLVDAVAEWIVSLR